MTKTLTRTVVRTTERGLVATRAVVGSMLDRLQLRLRAIDVARDPEVKAWIAETRRRVESGEVERRLATQPSDPRELLRDGGGTATA